MSADQAPARLEPYLPNGGRAKAVIALFAAIVAMQVVLTVVTLLQACLLGDIAEGRPAPDSVLEANDARVSLVTWLDIGVIMITTLLFLRWVRRAYYNLVPLGAPRRRFEVGWSWGWFLIPFYNLVRPYQVMAEIRAAADRPGDIAHANAGRSLVGSWWASFLFMGFMNRAEAASWRVAKTAEEMITASWTSVAVCVVTVVAALIAIQLVRSVTGEQERMAAEIAQPSAPVGEAPPVG